jgi:hypothetical protein
MNVGIERIGFGMFSSTDDDKQLFSFDTMSCIRVISLLKKVSPHRIIMEGTENYDNTN